MTDSNASMARSYPDNVECPLYMRPTEHFQAWKFDGVSTMPLWLIKVYKSIPLPETMRGRYATATADGEFWRWFDADQFERNFVSATPHPPHHAQGSGNCGDIARRAVENAETAAQLEIKDPELRDSLIRNFVQELERFRGALEPFAKVAESDIGQDETDADTFQPMRSGYNREPLITVGDMRRASALTSTHSRCAKCHCETKGEAALVDGKIWCHPCADSVPSTSRCTCAAIVNPNIPHARTCPLSSTVSNTPEGK